MGRTFSSWARYTMGEVTRAEMETVHGRISDLKERVANLEAQQPHINAALTRIEKSVEKLAGHVSKGVWVILGLFIVALWKMILAGHVPGF
jgi:tetrahydromethanopterin S-methyltransferase subunit B